MLLAKGFPWAGGAGFWTLLPALAAANFAGLAVVLGAGIAADRRRARGDPGILRAFRIAAAGGAVAGAAGLAMLWPRLDDLFFSPGGLWTGSPQRWNFLPAGVAFGLMPLLVGAVNVFVSLAWRAEFVALPGENLPAAGDPISNGQTGPEARDPRPSSRV
ncbi:MAG: hypothetical protein L0216_18065 [Planctomycetales bacterium]|nr:hypothetical protein [Planctomycetales bacterium]